ncbi:g9061 [Coccomyxa elongata]
MCRRQRARGWTSVLTAVLLCTILFQEVHAYDRVPDGQLSPLLHRNGQDVVSEKVPAWKRALHGGVDATEDDATHRITAGAMHAKMAARPVTPEDDAAEDDATHRLTAGAMHANKPARPQRERRHEKHHIPQSTSHAGQSSQESFPEERRTCRAQDLFSQSGSLPGDWVPHPDPEWQGLYVAYKQCPEFAMDFDCTVGMGEVYHRNRELAKTEFNKVFRPHKCELQGFDGAGFAKCLAGRRLIMIGDSTMNGIFSSLGCMLKDHLTSGRHQPWDMSDMTKIHDKFEYTSRSGDAVRQVTGEMMLGGGGEIHLRGFGRFNLTLWDKVLAELEPITERDTIMVNFGAWYHRFFHDGGTEEWKAWKDDMFELVNERLSTSPAQIIWKGYTTFHYDGETGAFTGVQQELSDIVPPLEACKATNVGEYWFDDQMHKFLKECGQPCAKIGILPLFQASLSAHNMHHGMYGRGREENEIDCTHYCNHARDVWSTILYNYMCG